MLSLILKCHKVHWFTKSIKIVTRKKKKEKEVYGICNKQIQWWPFLVSDFLQQETIID